jgi:hypothetical protein
MPGEDQMPNLERGARRAGGLALALLVGVCSASAGQDSPRLPRVFVESPLTASGAVAVVEAGTGRPVAVGARVDAGRIEELTPAMNGHLGTFRTRGIPLWLVVGAPHAAEDMPAWQAGLRTLLASFGSSVAIVEVVVAAQPDTLWRFALKVAATEARAAGRTLVAVGGRDPLIAGRVVRSLSREDAPYVDLVSVTADFDGGALKALAIALPELRVVRHDLDAGGMDESRRRVARAVLMTVGTSEVASAWRGAPAPLADAIRALSPVADLLSHEVQVIDPDAAELSLMRDGHNAADAVQHRVLFDEQTFSTYLIYEGAASGGSLDVGLRVSVDGVPAVIDLVAGARTAVAGYQRNAAASRATARVPLTGRPMVVNFSEGATEQFVDRTGVAAERRLAVAEIIARHREYRARHDSVLRNYRASALMEQHFRPTLTDTGYDVVTENEYFVDDEGVEWEERSFSVNGSKWGSDRPPFPLLQPEKVLSLPLELRLDQDYRYELDGIERVGDAECYRVRFEPTRDDAALYRGTVWIDRVTFARWRVRAVQTRTSAPVVSNEEEHTYQQVADVNGFPLLLLSRLTARQIILIAGRNLLLEKAATFSNFRVNDSEFGLARDAARQGPSVMYRDTERGVRYFVKDGETRVIRDRATASARAMAMGVMVDPSFAFPLPIFGINYLDFEFRGRPDTQFALLFGGVLAAGNLQRPQLGGTNLDASVDFFAIAAPASDRLYAEGGERESEALLTWPLTTGVNLGWQYTAFQKAQLQYQLRYDAFVRDHTTDPAFVVPNSTATQGTGAAWEYKRGGYSLGATGTFFARAHWDPWGPANALETDAPRTYWKYAVHASRDFFIDTFQKIHLNGSFFGGERLDRFSRYQFGMFDDTRIHGVPASGVRFDQLAMARGSYSFNIFEQYRLDLFAEQAWGQDRTVDTSWQPLTGFGMAVNLRAPWNTILRADVGKSILPDRYSGAGSTVLQIMLLKPLGR